jgi:hypothetical protein
MRNSMFGTRAFARTAALAMIGLLAQSVPALGQFGGGSPDPMVRVGFGRGVTVPVSDAGDALKNGVNGAGFVLVNLFGSGLPSLAIRVHVRRFDYKPTVANGAVGSTSTTNPGSSQILGGTGGIKIISCRDRSVRTLGRLSAFVEGRIQNVFTQSSGLLKRSSIQSVPVTLGVLF